MKTPILDKYRLHPFSGYCTCFSHPHWPCEICNAVKDQQKRWDKLTPEELKMAHAEYEREYPPVPDKGR